MLPQLMEVQMNWRNRKFRWVDPAYTELRYPYAFNDPPTATDWLFDKCKRRERESCEGEG
jgi:hypothetical protein